MIAGLERIQAFWQQMAVAMGVKSIKLQTVSVEQVSLAVLFVNVLKDPPVAVRIGELHIFQLGIEIGSAGFL